MDDTALQDLAWQLGREWPALGANLGITRAQIEHIKADSPFHMNHQIMEMLVTWRRGLGRDADPKQLLVGGLDAIGRADLAAKVATNELVDSKNRTDRTDFDLKACRTELVDYYLNILCKVRMHPLIPSLVRDFGSIYSDLQMVYRTHERLSEQSETTESSSPETETNTKATQLSHQNLVSLDGRGSYRVLLTGKTGSGKSTLLIKLTHDWSNLTTLADVGPSNLEAGCSASESFLKPGSPLSKFTLLFTLKLNQMSENPNLVDAIFDQILSRDTKVSKNGLRNYIENHQDEVLFLLDGLDELPPNVLGKTESTDNLKDVFLCRALRRSCIIVTSKHHIANQYSKIFPLFARVETTGFGLRGREEYINKYFKNKQTGAKLISAIRSSVTLSSLSEIPLLLQMICLVWADRSSLPGRLTELYDNAVRILLMHHDGKKEDSLPGRSELPDGLMKRLGRVALEGLLDKEGERLVFPADDFQQGDAAKGCEIGLLVPEDTHKELDVQSTVAFLHVSFQELCAASYLADLFKTDKKRFVRYVSKFTPNKMVNMEYLLRFCCGKSKKAARWILLRAKKLQKRCVLYSSEFQHLRLMLYLEAGSETLISLLSDVSFHFLGGEHLNAAHYFVQGTRSLPKITSLHVQCATSAETCLVMNILHHTPNLETLIWSCGEMAFGKDESSVAIPVLTNLKAMSFKPRGKRTPHLYQGSLIPNFVSHQTNLSTIHLSYVNMHDKVSVFETQSRVLESLRLKYCYLVLEDMLSLCRILSDAKHLNVLDLSGNNLSGTLDCLIPIVPRLKELNLSTCGLRDRDSESLGRVLSATGNLDYLILSMNTIPGLLDIVIANARFVQTLKI